MHQILFKAFVWKQQVIYLQIFLLEQGDKPEKGVWGGVDVEMGDCHFFVTLQFSHIYCMCGESKIPFITFWIFSLLS